MTTLNGDESTHRWPQAVPGSQEIVFTIGLKGAPSFDDADIAVHSVTRGQTNRLLKGTSASYVNTGHIVFLREGSLMAAAVDRSLTTVGPPFVAVEGVGARPFSGTGWYAVAHSGTVVYASALGATDRSLVSVDRTGRTTPTIPYQKAYTTPAPVAGWIARRPHHLLARRHPGSVVIRPRARLDDTPHLRGFEHWRQLVAGRKTRGVYIASSRNVFCSMGHDARGRHGSTRQGRRFSDVGDLMGPGWRPPRHQSAAAPDRVGHSDCTARRNCRTGTVACKLDSLRAAACSRPTGGGWLTCPTNPDGSRSTCAMSGSGSGAGRCRWTGARNLSGRAVEPSWVFVTVLAFMAVSITRSTADEPRVGAPMRLFEGTYEQEASSGYANFDAGDERRPFLMLQNAGGLRTPSHDGRAQLVQRIASARC